MENWKVSINELITIFRESLIAIVPICEKAKITWKYEDSWDDWDVITEALFQAIVISPIENDVNFDFSTYYQFPKYYIDTIDYSNFSFISVNVIENDSFFAFSGFKGEEKFQQIMVTEIDPKTLKWKENSFINLDLCSFRLVLNKKGKLSFVEDLEVLN